jgi:hypothetical protein
MGRRGSNGFITRFTTSAAGFRAGFIGAFAALGISTDFSLVSDFVINFLVGLIFLFSLDDNFFTALGLTATFAWTFDFTVMTHILPSIIETPSASFFTEGGSVSVKLKSDRRLNAVFAEHIDLQT